jgi:hypothetical protein
MSKLRQDHTSMFTKSRSRLWRLAACGGTVVATALAVAASTQGAVTAAQAATVAASQSAESSNVSASWTPNGTNHNVFYVAPNVYGGANDQIHNWFCTATCSNGQLTGEAVAPGTGVDSAWQPNDTSLNVFYVGANHQIYTWLYRNGIGWTNSELGPGGEAAAAGTGVAAVWEPNGHALNVFYVGANGQIYNWYCTPTCSNGPLTGEPAAPGASLAAAWQPNGTTLNVFYVGANGQIYTLRYQNGWTNSELGPGKAAKPHTGLTAVWEPNGHALNVFYVGANGQIYNWYWTGTWSNGPLTGEAAQPHTGVSAAWQPNGTAVNVFYVGVNGQIYTWLHRNGIGWTNSELGPGGEAAKQGTGVPIAWNPTGTQASLFYKGANGQIYNWYGNGTTWTNAPL